MNQAKVAATFSALTAFKRQKIDLSGYRIVHLSILMSREHTRKQEMNMAAGLPYRFKIKNGGNFNNFKS
jgi:hypothetical protein